MIYQILKEIGAMASVLDFNLHGVILTGGVSKDPYVAAKIIQGCEKLAPVFHYPGENENEAIARAVDEALSGKAIAQAWPDCLLPKDRIDPLSVRGWKDPAPRLDARRRSSLGVGATGYEDIERMAKALSPVDVSVAQAEDREVLESLVKAQEAGFVGLCHLSGDVDKILEILESLGADRKRYALHPAANPAEAAAKAVRAVRESGASILVKGSLKSEYYLKAILDRTEGLREAPVLSNLSLFQMPSYHKLLAVSDNAILVAPGVEEKAQIIRNAMPLFSALGRRPLLVAALAAVETVSDKMPATKDAAALAEMSARGEFGDCIVEGPFGYDAAIDRECAVSKGLSWSRVCGQPDLLVAPNLETANSLGKSYKFHGKAIWGGLVLGAKAPAVLNSRSDDAENRYRSLLLARITVEGIKETKGARNNH
jgi:phosphate butyryltransferase